MKGRFSMKKIKENSKSRKSLNRWLILPLCAVILCSCGNTTKEISGNESMEITSDYSATDKTESPTENTDASENADISFIPETAVYKQSKYMIFHDESILQQISYFNEYDDEVRTISYFNNEPLQILDIENEYNSNGQLVRMKDDESYAELEYNEKGCLKKITTNALKEESNIIEFEYEYDEQDRPVIVKEYWNGSNELFSTTYKTYDENGNITNEKTDFKDGRLESDTVYEYDEKGRVVCEEYSFSKSKIIYEYKYENL